MPAIGPKFSGTRIASGTTVEPTTAHYEREGKKTEAINAYQDFLNHFENSTARLPQIAEARAALKRLL